MKTLIKVLFITLLGMTIQTGCSSGGKEDIPEPTPPVKENDYLNLSVSTHNITAEGGSINLSFTTNTAWTVSCSQDWCTLSADAGEKGTQNLKATLTANPEETDRTATITIKAGTATENVTILQYRHESIVTEKSVYEIGAEGGKLQVKVTSNIEYKVTASPEWITVAGNENGVLTLEVEKNNTEKTREASVKLSGEYISTSFTVHQVHKSTGNSGINGMPNTDWNS